MLAENAAAVKVFEHVAGARVAGADHGVVELLMDLPDEGIPNALRRTVRAVASGEARHHTGFSNTPYVSHERAVSDSLQACIVRLTAIQKERP